MEPSAFYPPPQQYSAATREGTDAMRVYPAMEPTTMYPPPRPYSAATREGTDAMRLYHAMEPSTLYPPPQPYSTATREGTDAMRVYPAMEPSTLYPPPRPYSAATSEGIDAMRDYPAMEPSTLDPPPQLSFATPPQEPQLRGTPSLSSYRNCIRLRGLPYEAEGDTVVGFLGEHARNIVHQGVHIIYKPDCRPSGDAFVEMNSEDSAGLAAATCHRRYIRGWGKVRLIRVYQCSREDIANLGAAPVTASMLLPPPVGPQLPYGRHDESRLPMQPSAAAAPTPPPLVASPMVFPPITYLPYWCVSPSMAQQLFNGMS